MQQTGSMAPHHYVPGSEFEFALTNPDMILPYDLDSTSSRREWQGSDLDFSGANHHIAQIGTPLTPTTPILYGNGTMLSDIGEVTEAESTPGQRTRTEEVRIAIKNRDHALNSSPTMGYNAVLKRTRGGNHERKVSVESTSTVTSQGQTAQLFDDFDDSISVEDSNFQGDDEESVYEGVYEDEQPSQPLQHFLTRQESSNSPEEEDKHSSAALSRRAELILANAKRRLDTMEGNLSRARSSLYITPSPSLSSINSSSPLARSTPSPQFTQLGIPPSRHRGLQSPGHSRVSSENNVPSSMSTNRYFIRSSSAAAVPVEDHAPSKATTRYPVRSASAAAVTRDSTRGNPSPSHFVGAHRISSHTRTSPPHGTLLVPLSEDDTISNLTSPRTSIAESHFSTASEHRTLTRSTSSMQMRDLRDQMKDLKGKISTLRDRAREENMRRRSLQSLRTPSPFTAAEQWYTQGTAYNEKIHQNHEMAPSAWNGEASAPLAVQPVVPAGPKRRTSFDTVSVYEDVQESLTGEFVDQDESPAVQNIDRQLEVTSRQTTYELANEDVQEEVEDMNTEYGSDYGEEVVDYEELDGYPSESEASYYHESLETAVSHEDREDAFDYQNFFLHSAMGSLRSQRERRDSVDSYDSEDSVETERGVVPPSSMHQEEVESTSRFTPAHERKTSGDSISTLATFATANEDQEDEDEYPEDEFPEESPEFEEYSTPTMQESRSATSTPLTARRDTFPEVVDPVSPRTTTFGRRDTFGPEVISNPPSASSHKSLQLKPIERILSPGPVVLGKPINAREPRDPAQNDKRPSVSSFSSSGTARSFPLVKPKTPTSTPSPIPPHSSRPGSSNENTSPTNSSSEKEDARRSFPKAAPVSQTNGCENDASEGEGASNPRDQSPVNMLVKEDQVLVERVVASLGKCVLGMQEVSRGSTEGRMWRRRLDVARRVLEGMEVPGHGSSDF